jgi:hypothetical protein
MFIKPPADEAEAVALQDRGQGDWPMTALHPNGIEFRGSLLSHGEELM